MLNMTEFTQEQLSSLKRYFKADFTTTINALGYDLMMSTSLPEGLVARIVPMKAGQSEIPDDLLDRVREDVLPKLYQGVPIHVIRGNIYNPLLKHPQ